jgi:hypothetical protein
LAAFATFSISRDFEREAAVAGEVLSCVHTSRITRFFEGVYRLLNAGLANSSES